MTNPERRRGRIGDLHCVDIYECPIVLVKALAETAGSGVTVENLSPVRAVDQWFEMTQALVPDGRPAQRRIRNAVFDVALTNAEFLDHLDFWDQHGVYANFTERSPIAFQASRLEEPARYQALANFGFVLEVALAGPASDGWSRIVSPREELIELAMKNP